MNLSLRTILLVCLFLFGGLVHAQRPIPLGRTQDRINLIEDQVQGLRLHIDYAQLQSNRLELSEGTFSELTLDGGLFDGAVGDPKLPITQQLIEIPFGAEVEVEVLHYTTAEFDLADYEIETLMPVQAPVSKNDYPEEAPFVINKESYTTDDYLGQPLAQVQVLGTLRGYRLAKLTLSPVSYNPVRHSVKVCNDIELMIRFQDADMALTQEVKAKTRSPYFDFIQDLVLNAAVSRDYPDHPDMTRYPVKYVIVADRMFDGYLNEFIDWKTKKGFQVVLAYTDEIGNTVGAIQAFLHGLYNNATAESPAPSFILFVGDTQQIPTYIGTSSQKVTDLYYASVDNDYLPEMYYGRFSAQNASQLLAQIEKTLYYEQYRFMDPSYLDRVTLIAGWDDYWNYQIGQPTIRYGMENWFDEEHGYTGVYPYYGPDDYDGCYEDDKISVGVINYTAHCSETVWGTPALSASNIYSMHNEGFYPLAIGNCCESSQFGYSECVGEAWVRADKKGAVCYLGSAPSTYWYEDAWWAMGAYNITNANLGQAPQYEQTTMGSYDAMHEGGYVSVGGVVFCGNLAVTEACNHGWSNAARYYWEAYNVLGDPSLVCYHTEGIANAVSHEPVLYKGLNHFSLQAEEGSYVGLSKDGVLLGNGMVGESGSLTLDFTPVTEGGFVDLVVTKPQRIPYIRQIPVATAGQPFLIVTSVNPANFAYNKDTELDITVKNVGEQVIPANTVIELQSQDERMLVLDSQCQIGQAIPVGGTAVVNDAFKVKAGADVYNGEQFRFVTLADCGDQVNSDFYVSVTKPVFEFVGFDWDHAFVSGHSFDLRVTFRNVGGCAAEAPMGRIVSDIPGIQFEMDEVPLDRLEVGEETTCRFVVQVPESVDESVTLEFEVSLVDAGVNVSQHISMYNLCDLVLELRDAGGNGWEGAVLKMLFQDGTPPTQYELQDGSLAVYELTCRQGYKLRLSWTMGSNDSECGFTLKYKDGSVIYESVPDMHGNLLTTTIDCSMGYVGFDELKASTHVTVFPNPASGQITVVSESPMSRCLMMNCLGQIVVDKQLNDKEIAVPLDGVAPGIYLLRVTTLEGEVMQKIMIK